MSYNYRVYGWKREGGIDKIIETTSLSKAIISGRNLKPAEYVSYLIIQHDIERDSDFPIIRENLYKNKEYKKGR